MEFGKAICRRSSSRQTARSRATSSWCDLLPKVSGPPVRLGASYHGANTAGAKSFQKRTFPATIWIVPSVSTGAACDTFAQPRFRWLYGEFVVITPCFASGVL